MAVDKKGESVEKGQLDPKCPCFAGLNISFPEPSWNFIQRAVSIFYLKLSWLFLNASCILAALGSEFA